MAHCMMKIIGSIIFIFFFISSALFGQDDLESFLNPISDNQIVINTFKSTRLINNHSVEVFAPKQLDLRISHRFGELNSGLYELYGLDQATIRIGLEYGLMKNMMVGFGRSTYNKTYDGYLKYAFLKQSRGDKSVPISIVSFSNFSLNTLKQNYSDYPFLGRLSFCNQLLISSKINSKLSIQIMPTWVHWNMVQLAEDKNDIFVFGGGFRYLISKSVSINSEYFIRINDSESNMELYHNSFSVGVDIETGGHVFQLHITNSMPMIESSFMTRTTGDWSEGGVHFGFNISREFNL